MIKAIIFDNDGVVIDSGDIDFLAWVKIFSEFDKNLTREIYKEYSGMTGVEISMKYLGKTREEGEKLQDKKEEYFEDLVKEHGLKEIKGLREFLDKVVNSGLKTALATAGTRIKAEFTLGHLGIREKFNVLVTANDVSKGKPDPETFLKAAELLQCKPEECVVIEDSRKGIKAAKKGGIKAIGITTAQTKEKLLETGADIVIDSFEDIKLDEL